MADTAKISSGTAEGAIEFTDWLVEKGYATPAAVGPWRSAMRQIFTAVEGEKFGDADVRELDIDAYCDRFENMVGAQYKVESLASYRARFRKAIGAYRAYLEDRTLPTFRTSPRRSKPKDTKLRQQERAATTGSTTDARSRGTERTQEPSPGLIEYPFPLEAGGVARLRLPAQLARRDAERLAAFVRTLVFEPPRELPRGDHSDEAAE